MFLFYNNFTEKGLLVKPESSYGPVNVYSAGLYVKVFTD